MILQIQTILSDKTYLSNQPHPEWKVTVETHLVKNLERFVRFLKDYLPTFILYLWFTSVQ